MDNQGNRLYLNFGNNNDRLAANNDRAAYPTTPSTFPQPVFSSSSSQPLPSSAGGASSQQGQSYSAAMASSTGYFMQNPYPMQYPPVPHSAHSDYGGAPVSSGASYQQQQQPQLREQQQQQRSNTPGATSNDPNTGLAHQFSHQNLGGAARASPYGSRGPSPSQRPRTAGATASQQQSAYSSYLSAPMPTPPPVFQFQTAPERNPDRYGPNANNSQKKCSQLATDFFKDSVKRARERNQR